MDECKKNVMVMTIDRKVTNAHVICPQECVRTCPMTSGASAKIAWRASGVTMGTTASLTHARMAASVWKARTGLSVTARALKVSRGQPNL